MDTEEPNEKTGPARSEGLRSSGEAAEEAAK